MHIKELVIKNFKSFDFVKIPFKNGLHVVVGPNGSGKSNIVDAILFAFGCTSLKRLRVDKLSDLVNHHTKSNIARVRVVITHNNEDIEIAREIDDTGKSIFYIGDKRKALNEITSYLSELGFDQDAYNTVQQGDVTKIINLNTEERRKIIDDVSGISLFDARKEEAEQNLKKVDARLEKVNIALNERRPYIEQLKKEKEDALKYKELDDKENLYNFTLFKKQISAGQQEVKNDLKIIDENKKKIKELIAEKEGIESSVLELEEKLEAINSELIAHSEKVQSTFGKQVSELNASREIASNSLAIDKENLNYLESENSKATEILTQLKKEQEMLKAVLVDLNKKLAEKRKVRDNFKDKITKDQEIYEKHKLMQKELYQEIDSLGKLISEKQDKYLDIRDKLNSYNLQVELAEKQQKDKKEQADILKNRHKDVFDELSRMEKELKLEDAEIKKKADSFTLKEKEIKKLEEKITQSKIKLVSLQKDLSFAVDISKKSELIKKKLSSFSSYCGYLEDIAELEKSQKQQFAGYVVLENDKELKKIIDELDVSLVSGISFVVLSVLGVKKTELKKYVRENIVRKDAKNIDIPELYFDGFCFKRLRIGDSKELEMGIIAVEKELQDDEKQLKTFGLELENLSSELEKQRDKETQIKIKLSTHKEIISDIEQKLAVEVKGNAGSQISKITLNIGQLNTELSSLEDDLSSFKKKKQELEAKLKEASFGLQSTVRDEYDLIVSEINLLEQGLISKESDLKIANEKILTRQDYIETNNQKIADIKKHVADGEGKKIDVEAKLSSLQVKLKGEDAKKQNLFSEKSMTTSKINELTQKAYSFDSQISDVTSEINSLNISVSTNQSKVSQLEQNLSLMNLDRMGLVEVDLEIDMLNSSLRNIRREKNALGNINFNAIESYDKLAKEYEEIIAKYDVLIKEKEQVQVMLSEINMKKQKVFMDCFEKINKEFKNIISKMSKSLTGELELEGENTLSSKLIITITKGGKKKSIDIMSGGEKTITALAFIFALRAYRETPFYILDEVDAALDDYNSSSLLNYLKEVSKKVTIIAISHNGSVVSGADQVIGVTLKEHTSVVGLDLRV